MRLSFLLAALVTALSAGAARDIGLEADAFNRVCPISSAANLVFSPMSFEIDCALVAESLPTIPKANVSETMGVVLDFESAYRPILEAYETRTNGFSFIAARAFCLPDLRTAHLDHRHHLERAYGAEVLPLSPSWGAVSWFRASMEGAMEDFTIRSGVGDVRRYCLYDLVSFSVAWERPFPRAKTRRRPFRLAKDAGTVELDFMSDVREADTWTADVYTLLRLPLAGDAWFFALLPNTDEGLAAARADFSSLEIGRLLTVPDSLTEAGVAHGPCAIALPRLVLSSQIDLSGAFRYFRIPLTGLELVAGSAPARECVQHVRFRLDEGAAGEAAEAVPPGPAARELVFDRPFVFFVYHKPTQTIPVAGHFAGRD